MLTSCVSIIRNVFGNQLVDSHYEPNQQIKNFYTQIPYFITDGYIIIKAKVNDTEKEYNFIFDTGATTYISEKLIVSLNLKNGINLVSKDVNGNNVTGLSFLSTLKIGELTIDNLRINSTNSEIFEDAKCYGKIDGIIGSNVLKQGFYYFNSSNKTLIITNQLEKLPKEKLANSQKIKRKMGKIYIPVFGYKKEWLLLDTGYADGNIILNKNSSLVSLNKKPLKEFEYYLKGLNSEKLTKISCYEQKIKIFKSTINTSLVRINRENSSNSIGNKFIRDNDIILDVKHKKIFATILNKNSVDTIPNIGLKYLNGIVKVNKIVIGSSINLRGIKLNDTVSKINNIKISDFKSECDFLNFKKVLFNKKSSIDIEIFKNKKYNTYSITKKAYYE